MKTKTRVAADIDSLEFGYWDPETEDFIPVDVTNVDQLKQAAAALECSERLIDTIGTLTASISELISSDLKDIWERLDRIEH